MADYRCADTLPDATTGAGAGDGVVRVVFNGDSFLALSASERVAILDPDTQTTRVLWRGRFGALADDGSVGLTFGPSPTGGVALEVRDLASDDSLAHTTFENGLAGEQTSRTLAVSRAAVVVRQSEAECETCGGAPSAPATTVVQWELASSQISRGSVDQGCGAKSMFSRDGRTFMCVSSDGDHVSWSDGASRAWPSSLAPGSNWRPPSRPASGLELSAVEIGSAVLSSDGRSVYLAYRRSPNPDEPGGRAPRRGWRLERWTPTPGEPQTKVQTLASSPEQLCTDLLAVSPDGRLFVFGGARHRASVRHAPDYADAPLGESTAALSAAFSWDGAWLVTGHADGHLELWDVKTLKSRLTTHPKWRGDE